MIDRDSAIARLSGCYVTIPTLFHNENLEVNLAGMRRHVRFLLDGGIRAGTGALLVGGAAGDFSTLSFEERLRVTEAVLEENNGKAAVVMGAQTTSTLELVKLATAAQRLGAEYIQVSPPFYFEPTEGDLYDYVRAASEAADIGIVLYNTFWTSLGISNEMVGRFTELSNIIGLKWAVPKPFRMHFERMLCRFARNFCVIDNQHQWLASHILGARGIECHVCNYWPQWGVKVWGLLEDAEYVQVQRELVRVSMPFLALWEEMEQYTNGDGYLDKLCMELVGLDSSRCRPPTRDIRSMFRTKALKMLQDAGTPMSTRTTVCEEAATIGKAATSR